MKYQEILSKVDHTFLSRTATWHDIKKVCDEGIKYKTASICIPACYVKEVKCYSSGKINICTVIGFPNGYNTAESKIFETADAIKNGANEIDMVINLGYVKQGLFNLQLDEIKSIKQVCGDKILKVIIETCLLSDEEKIKMCEVVAESGADFIKTSTGFAERGASFEDVSLISKHLNKNIKIKAAGGISSLDDARKFIDLGAARLGTSRIVKIIESLV
ncbi:MAG: deoxyribose-phosphate aldolase [Oscillospiraceae bacterium]|jgi:deoxyribose-phosphate aldolase|nr:deoxyribose-phosphate aldolase [Oscillospiraceae bacterium]